MALASDLVQIGFSSKQADFIGSTTADALTATGVVQATGYPITKSFNHFTTCVAGVNDGVLLPAINSFPGDIIVVGNDGAGAMKVYPASGEFLDAAAVNTPIVLAAGVRRTFYKCNSVAQRWLST